jgi:hypothetical protein
MSQFIRRGLKILSYRRKKSDSCSFRKLRLEQLDERAMLSATLPSGGLTPLQIAHAYGYDKIQFAGGVVGNGSGQTIAIVDAYDDPALVSSSSANFASSDLHMFDLQFGLPDPPSFVKVGQTGSTTALPAAAALDSYAIETSMDVEWAHALAPAANIVLVEANSDGVDLPTAEATAANWAGVSVVSLSYGAPENQAASLGWYPAFDQIFSQHPNVTFVVSSGDQHEGEAFDYPASSTYALAVGGTEFVSTTTPVVDPEGDYVTEDAWNEGRDEASGGGISSLEAPAYWQPTVTGDSTQRTVPDVAFHAFGSCYVYDSYDYPSSPWSASGGTSVAAPSWAALVAIADQGYDLSTGSTVGLGYHAIDELYKTYSESLWYSMAFHDITAGNNNFYNALTGYDLTTGLGTPHADVIAGWLGQSLPAPTATSPTNASTVNTTTPTLQWSAVSDAVGYSGSLYDQTTGVTTPFASISNSYTVATALTPGNTYSWSIAPAYPDLADSATTGEELAGNARSATFTFYVPLAVPSPVAPSSGATITSTLPTFSWSAALGAASYNLAVTDTTTSQSVINQTAITGTSYTPTVPLTRGDSYSWTVSAVSSQGTVGTASTAIGFTIGSALIPTVTASDAGGVYNGSPFAATATVTGDISGVDTTPAASLEGVSPTFTYYVGSSVQSSGGSSTAPSAVGTYTVVASFAGSADYAAAQSQPVTFTIVAAQIATPGLYDPASSWWYLRNANTSGGADIMAGYGPPAGNWIPLVGDWTGNGIDSLGLYNPATGFFYLRNSNTTGVGDITFFYGDPGQGWLPVVGDWTGQISSAGYPIDTVGLYDPKTCTWYLRNELTTGVADITIGYGPPGQGWQPLVGDWDGNGTTTVGLYNPATGYFYLRNSNTTGVGDITFFYGDPTKNWTPVAGDWTGDGHDSIGMYDPSSGTWYLRNELSTGVADLTFGFGSPGAAWLPVVGDWTGLSVGAPASASTALSQTDAQSTGAAAGVSSALPPALSLANYLTSNLPIAEVKQVAANTAAVDQNTVGQGLPVDPTPVADNEFARLGSSPQLSAIDPWALDHVAGLDDSDSWSTTLVSGARRLPGPTEIDAIFAHPAAISSLGGE